MSATEKVVNDLNVSKLMLCNPKMLTSEMYVRIGQAINGAIDLLKEQEPVPPIKQYDGNPKFWTSWWYVCGNCETPIDCCDKFCRRCGRMVKWE